MANQAPQALLRRVRRLSNNIMPSIPSGTSIDHDPRIEFRLIPEMIVHRCDINPSAFGNRPDGGTLKSLLGEHFAGRAEDLVAGLFFADFRSGPLFFPNDHPYYLNICLKQSSKTFV